MFDEIRKGLIEAYKHKHLEEFRCVVCGAKKVKFALHVIEFYHHDSISTPACLVKMSHSRETMRGSVPICEKCCPPCRKCDLPIATTFFNKVVQELKQAYPSVTFVIGNGICKHIHVIDDMMAIFKSKRLMGLVDNTSTTPKKNDDYETTESIQLDHRLGIKVVCSDIEAEGFEIVSVNVDIKLSPQIIAKKGDQLHFFIVITSRDIFPELSDSLHKSSCEHARKFKALAMFAPVQLLPSGDKNEEGQDGFYAKYLGYSCINDPLGLFSDDTLRTTIHNLAKQSQLSAASGRKTTFTLPDFVRTNMLKSDILRHLQSVNANGLGLDDQVFSEIRGIDLNIPLGDISKFFDAFRKRVPRHLLLQIEDQIRRDDALLPEQRYHDIPPVC